ncbi:hypothetical protein [Hymenobacter volaticus]|uniref:DUF3592 domain-containing protein n=1 Tax=Hymenobacter volaticus TaxID=2932254 RepID=A0ABY4G2F9_9BACT|nr:hypothetical protein [Hymenobacter volaticus]UOQ64849.1 hypothetical protein MUN86_14900 [Hymenobacter volaticus]
MILSTLFFLAFGIGNGYEAKVSTYLLEKGQLIQVPVANKRNNRKHHSVGFWLNNDIHYLSLAKEQYDTVAVGDLIHVLYGPETDYVMWPTDSGEVKKLRQQVMGCFLMAAVCGGFLFWHWKPKSTV